jgi:hypothetical protein
MDSGCARASPGAFPIGLSFDAWMYHTKLGELIDRAMFESNFSADKGAAAMPRYGTPSSASPSAAPPPRNRRCRKALQLREEHPAVTS